jgi:exosortase/archaeosortase family protein
MQNNTQINKKKTVAVLQAVKRSINILKTLLPIFSFIPPFLILYSLYSWSFEQTYQGRTLLLFFLWLILLEIILGWENLQKSKLNRLRSLRTVLFVIALLLPTIYVVAANYCGLNTIITGLTKQAILLGDPLMNLHASLMSLSVEYMVFAVLSCLTILLAHGVSGLTDFSISILFVGMIGMLFAVDNLYPYGRFSPFQILVPTTATLAASVLNLMGYATIYGTSNSSVYGFTPYIKVKNFPWANFGIAWQCSGIESLLIYTVTILLFLKKTDVPIKHRIVYFVIGAIVAYFINILRVVTLFTIAIGKGPTFNVSDYDWQKFHNYYGMLYSITWIISYPLLIIGSRALWTRIKTWKTRSKESPKISTQIKPF